MIYIKSKESTLKQKVKRVCVDAVYIKSSTFLFVLNYRPWLNGLFNLILCRDYSGNLVDTPLTDDRTETVAMKNGNFSNLVLGVHDTLTTI